MIWVFRIVAVVAYSFGVYAAYRLAESTMAGDEDKRLVMFGAIFWPLFFPALGLRLASEEWESWWRG